LPVTPMSSSAFSAPTFIFTGTSRNPPPRYAYSHAGRRFQVRAQFRIKGAYVH
jgi:hypothetical protein